MQKQREVGRTTLKFGKMKIRKENFDKLKQLDRIEFRQRKEIIDKKFDFSFVNEFTLYLVLFIIIINLAKLPRYVLFFNPEEYSFVLFLSTFLMILFIGIVAIRYFSLIVKQFIGLILTKKLEEEYFTEEVKVKK